MDQSESATTPQRDDSSDQVHTVLEPQQEGAGSNSETPEESYFAEESKHDFGEGVSGRNVKISDSAGNADAGNDPEEGEQERSDRENSLSGPQAQGKAEELTLGRTEETKAEEQPQPARDEDASLLTESSQSEERKEHTDPSPLPLKKSYSEDKQKKGKAEKQPRPARDEKLPGQSPKKGKEDTDSSAPPLKKSYSEAEQKKGELEEEKKKQPDTVKRSAEEKESTPAAKEETKSVTKPWDLSWPRFDYSTLTSLEDNESLGVYFDEQSGWRRCSFLYFLVEVPSDLLAQVTVKLQQQPEVDQEPKCDLLELPTEQLGLFPNLRLYRFTSKRPFKEFKAYAYIRRTVWKDSTHYQSQRTAKAVKEVPQQFVFQTNIQLPRNTMTSIPRYSELTYYALYLLTATDAAMTLPRLIEQFKTQYPPSYPGWGPGFEATKGYTTSSNNTWSSMYSSQTGRTGTSSYVTSPYYGASPYYGGSSYYGGGSSYSSPYGGTSYYSPYGGNSYYGAAAVYGGGSSYGSGYSYYGTTQGLEESRKFILALETHCTTQGADLPIFASILGLFGLLPQHPRVVEYLSKTDLPQLLELLHETGAEFIASQKELSGCFNELCRGLYSLMVADLSASGNNWQKILLQLTTTEHGESLFTRLMRDLKSSRISIKHEDAQVFEEALTLRQKPVTVDDIKYFASCISDLRSLIAYLSRFYDPSSTEGTLSEEVIKRILSDKLYYYPRTLEEAASAAEAVVTCPEALKPLVMTWSLIRNFASVFRGESYYVSISTDFALYEKVFKTWRVPELLTEVDYGSICRRLFYKKCSLSEVLNAIPLEVKHQKEAVSCWFKVSLSSSKITLTHFKSMIQELELLNPPTDKKVVAAAIVERTIQHDRTYIGDILRFAPAVDEAPNTDLAEQFVIKVSEKLEKLGRYQGLTSLAAVCELYPESVVLHQLVQALLAEAGNVSQEEVNQLLLTEASKDHVWALLIRQQHRFSAIQHVASLLNAVLQLGIRVSEGALSGLDFAKVAFHSKETRTAFVWFCTESMRINKHPGHSRFSADLETWLLRFQETQERLELLALFMESVGSKTQNPEAVQEMVDEAKRLFDQEPLNQFQLNPELEAYLVVAQQVEPALQSHCYCAYFLKPEQYALEELPSACVIAFEQMKTDLEQLISNIDTVPVVAVEAVFHDLTMVHAEITVLDTVLKCSKRNFLSFVNTLKFIKRYEELLQYSESLRKLIEFFQINDATFMSLEQTFRVSVMQNKDQLNAKEFVHYCQNMQAKLEARRPKETFEQAMKIVVAVADIDMLRFLLEVEEHEIDHMKESVNDHEEELHVHTQTVFDLEKMWGFVRRLKECASSEQLIRACAEHFTGKNFITVLTEVTNCSSSLQALKDLHKELNLKEEAKKKQVLEIATDSTLTIQLKNGVYDIELKYGHNSRARLDLEYLLELKDRVSLMLYTNEDEENDEINKLQRFIQLVNALQSITTKLNKLFDEGYPGVVARPTPYTCIDGSSPELTQFEEELSAIFDQWKQDLSNAYLTHPVLTFLFGRQFWILEDFFATGINADLATALMQFMGKDSQAVEGFVKKESITERFDELARALNSLPNTVNDVHSTEFQLFSKQVYYIESEDIAKSILSMSVLYGVQLPRSCQLLFCHNGTSLSQIEAFLHRCFSYPGRLHLVVNCENLSIESQHFFRGLFHKLSIDTYDLETAKVGFICRHPHSTLLSYFKHHDDLELRKMKENRMLDDQLVKEQLELVCQSTEVVTSAVSGLGKSTYVKGCAELQASTYLEFPVAGEVDLDRLGRRLSQLDRLNDHLLHIQLGQVDDCLLLDEFLVSLCLLRTFYYKEEPYVLPESTRLYVEVANTYQENLLQSLAYLKYVKQKHIDCFDLNNLLVSTDTYDPAQLVCTYLRMYKDESINTQQLDFDRAPLDKTEILPLLEEFFVQPQLHKGQSPTYTQLKIFLSVLHRMFLNFEMCYFFSVENVNEYISDISRFGFGTLVEQYRKLRGSIIACLLLSVEEFTTKSLNHIHQEQSRTQAFMNEQVDRSEALIDTFQCNLTWESTNHFNLIITENGSTMPIYRDQNFIEENIRKLLYIQANAFNCEATELAAKIESGEYALEDYSTMDHVQLLSKIKLYTREPYFEFIHCDSTYVMTPDNFLKMNLIHLRAQTGIPVVIMGETGCGKTSLVRFFVEAVLEEVLVTFPIHAGVTTTDIISRMNDLIVMAESLPKLWVFFDEFNTTSSIATICEILCNRTLEGHPLPPNVVCVGACNPYRLKTEHDNYDENVGIKKNNEVYNTQSRRLVHMVHPLPNSIIDYVWDFGSLTRADLRRYVAMMLKDIDPVFVDLICFSHAYFEEQEGVSSVSLRDVARFEILFHWFEASIRHKKGMYSSNIMRRNAEKFRLVPNRKHPVNPAVAAGILALTHCYYLRINSLKAREQYLGEVARASYGRFNLKDITTVMEIEQDDYLLRMDIPEGTALNRALRENIFAIIPCIFNKVPVFICGKPGCSKSLAIQLIFANLRGKKSQDGYFKTLPELIMVSFQGSDSCTSEGILKAFDKARKFLEIGKETQSKSVLPVVIFDEIGLAEISRNNPLKVLHNLLELENREIAFVGISNWRLDSSKMNRALYLARPDPPKKDLIATAMSIYEWSAGNETRYSKVITSLARAYHALKRELKNTDYADFFGLRDFYHLIKQVSHVLLSEGLNEKHLIVQVCKYSIQRNFGGYPPGTELMGTFFMREYKVEDIYPMVSDAPLLDMIEDNLTGTNSRYLMLMGRGDVANFLLKECRQKRQTRVIVGSNLDSDMSKEDYGFRSLSDIILYMERGVSIILQDMSHIYSSLYDLFNQNFVVSGNRRYCRIALGAHFNPRCFVHDDFHAIIFLDNDEKTVLSTDAPFLNRFEKHIVSLETLLSASRQKAIAAVARWVASFFTPGTLLTQNTMFPVYSDEVVGLLLLQRQDEEAMEDYIKAFLMKLAPADVLIQPFNQRMRLEEREAVHALWREHHQTRFPQYIAEMVSGQRNSKLMAFTFDNTMATDCVDSDAIVRNINNFHSEQQLKKDLQIFYCSPEKAVYVIELELSNEGKHILLVKSVIEQVDAEMKGRADAETSPKCVCILGRMARNVRYEESFLLLEGWDMQLFDSLGSAEFDFSLVNKTTKQLLSENQHLNVSQNIAKLTEKCLLNFKYEITTANPVQTWKRHFLGLVEKVGVDSALGEAFEDKILAKLEQLHRLPDWKRQIFENIEVVMRTVDLKSAVEAVLEDAIMKVYTPLVFLLESEQTFMSYFTCYDEPQGEVIRAIWLENFKVLSADRLGILDINQNAVVKVHYLLAFPFTKPEHRLLTELVKEYRAAIQDQRSDTYAVENFVEAFRAKTKLKQYAEQVSADSVLKQLYLADIIRIQTDVFHLNEEETQFVIELFTVAFDRDVEGREPGIERLLLDFYVNERTLRLLSHVLSACSELIGLQIQTEFLSALRSKRTPQISSMALIQHELNFMFSQFKLIDRGLSLQSLNTRLAQVVSLLFELKKADIAPPNTSAIEFWAGLVTFLISVNADSAILFQIAKLAEDLESSNLTSSVEFIDTVFTVLADYVTQSPQNFSNLQACVYDLSLKESPKLLRRVATSFDQSALWKNSALIMNRLVQQSSLHQVIQVALEVPRDSEHTGIERNDYLDCMEEVLSSQPTGKFAILLSDCLSAMTQTTEVESYEILSSFEWFDRAVVHYTTEYPVYPRLVRLIRFLTIKKYIQSYAHVLVMKKGLPETAEETVACIDQFLHQHEFRECWQLFSMKMLFRLLQQDDVRLVEFVTTEIERHPFLKKFEGLRPRSKLDIYPHLSNLPEINEYSLALNPLLVNGSDRSELLRVVQTIRQPRQKLAFGLAFINTVFSKHSTPMPPYAADWVRENSDSLTEALGPALVRFLQALSDNFPEAEYMRIDQESPPERLHRVLSMCYVTAILFAYHQQITPMTAVFFEEDGTIQETVTQRFNSKYVFGVETNQLYEHLKDINENFEEIKSKTWSSSYSKGGTYVCSSTCDFVYTIGDCGGPSVRGKCPFCGNVIGGQSHELVEREGHRNLSDEEAKKFLDDTVAKYEGQINTGRNLYGAVCSDAIPRGLNQVAYKLLHFMLETSLYMLYALKLVRKDQLAAMFSVPDDDYVHYFQSSIFFDLRTLGELTVQQDFFLWLYKTLGAVPTLLNQFTQSPERVDVRNAFEKALSQAIQPFIDSPVSAATEMSRELKEHSQSLGSLLDYIQELSVDETLPDIQYLRVVREPSVEAFKQKYYSTRTLKAYPLIDTFLRNEPDFYTLRLLHPLIELTNVLLTEYNHKITREEARQTTMRQVTVQYPQVEPLFANFLQAWDEYRPSDLQYGCKRLDPVIFTLDTPLISFLPDNKELSGGVYMLAALLELARTQNALLTEIYIVISKSRMLDSTLLADTAQRQVQTLTAENVLVNPLSDPEYVAHWSLNTPEYGHGSELIFDFENIHKTLVESLMNKKFLDEERVYLMQYQFELLSMQGQGEALITEIRARVPQSKLPEELEKELHKHFRSLETRDHRRYPAQLRELYGSLSYVLCYLKNVREVADTPLHSFCKTIDGAKGLWKPTTVTNTPLGNIIALYELVESKYFPYLVNTIRPEFKSDSPEVAQAMQKFMNECGTDGLPTKEELKCAIERLIVRCLNAELSPDIPMSMYIVRRGDFWNEGVDDALDKLLEQFPETILLKDTHQVYLMLSRDAEPPARPKSKMMRNSLIGRTR